MLKYYDTAIVFQEIPDEISLAINITNCPHRCVNCHSAYLREDIGTELTFEEVSKLIKAHSDITCVLFMGGDANHLDIFYLTNFIHNAFDLKVAIYSGDDNLDSLLLGCLDYYKYGSYQEDKGPLNKKTTNQKLLKIRDNAVDDITYKLQKENL